MPTLNEILTAIPTMTKSEQEQLQFALEAAWLDAEERDARVLYLIFRRRLNIKMPFTAMRHSRMGPHVLRGLSAVLQIIDDEHLQGKQRINAMYHLAYMISEHMEEHYNFEFVPNPLQTLGTAAQRAAAILEASFPGYREHGMVGFLLTNTRRQPTGGRERESDDGRSGDM